ncbi:MAG: hypothetical protein JNK45_10205 [Myxococcales bacterium]|nr:hypothetical protein [Myxococcales bacterium]
MTTDAKPLATAPAAAATAAPVEGPNRDDASAPDAPTTESGGQGRPPGDGTGWRRAARLLLAPILATAAVGVHWLVNVPPGGAKVSAKDQGAEKPAAKPKKPKKPAKKPGFEARPPGEVEATYLKFAEVAFGDEPVKSAWARPHQTLVNQAVAKARDAAFEGTPEEPRVSVDGVTCRTVRCQFVLRGPFAHEVDLLSDTLSKLQLGGASIWRLYTTEKISAPKPDQPKDDTYVRVTVSFMEDNMDNAKFAVPAGELGDADVPDGNDDKGDEADDEKESDGDEKESDG